MAKPLAPIKNIEMISNIIKAITIVLTSIGVFLLLVYYSSLMEYQTETIIKVNLIISVLIGTLQFLIYLANSKKHLKLVLKQNYRISTDKKFLKKMAWKRQHNFFSIPIAILGVSNLVLYGLFFNLVHNYWIGATSLLLTIPIYGYIESLMELKEIYSSKVISYSINENIVDYKIDNEVISYDFKRLNFLLKSGKELLLIDTNSKRKIILNLE